MLTYAPPNVENEMCKFVSIAIFAGIASIYMIPTRVSAESDGVFVIGALHALHEEEVNFDYNRLRELIVSIDPAVVVLEVRPEELSERQDTPGRPEYPAVLWDLLDEKDYEAVAMEPAGEAFRKLVEPAEHLLAAFEKENPETVAWLARYRNALTRALVKRWNGVADTQDEITDDLMRGAYIVEAELRGPELAAVQRNWDGHMIRVAEEAIRSNPARRVLIVCSYRNRHAFVDSLEKKFPDRMVDIPEWLARTEQPEQGAARGQSAPSAARNKHLNVSRARERAPCGSAYCASSACQAAAEDLRWYTIPNTR